MSDRKSIGVNTSGGTVFTEINSPDSNDIPIGSVSNYLDFKGVSAPSVSPAGEVRIYFDSASKKFKASEDGAAYADIVGGGGVTGSGILDQLAVWSSASGITGFGHIKKTGTTYPGLLIGTAPVADGQLARLEVTGLATSFYPIATFEGEGASGGSFLGERAATLRIHSVGAAGRIGQPRVRVADLTTDQTRSPGMEFYDSDGTRKGALLWGNSPTRTSQTVVMSYQTNKYPIVGISLDRIGFGTISPVHNFHHIQPASNRTDPMAEYQRDNSGTILRLRQSSAASNNYFDMFNNSSASGLSKWRIYGSNGVGGTGSFEAGLNFSTLDWELKHTSDIVGDTGFFIRREGQFQHKRSVNQAQAGNVTVNNPSVILPLNTVGNFFSCQYSGAALQIDRLGSTDFQIGSIVTIMWSTAGMTITHLAGNSGSNIQMDLRGSINFTPSNGDRSTFVYTDQGTLGRGTRWLEISRETV